MSNNNSSLMRCFSDFNALNNITDKNNIFKSKRQFNILICDDDSFTALSTRNLLLKCFNEKYIKTPEILFAHNAKYDYHMLHKHHLYTLHIQSNKFLNSLDKLFYS